MRVDQVQRIARPRNGKRHRRRRPHLPRRQFDAQFRQRRIRDCGNRKCGHWRPGCSYCPWCGKGWWSGLRPQCADQKATQQESTKESPGRPFDFWSFVVHWVAFLIRRAVLALNKVILSDAGGPARSHWQLTWPARVHFSDFSGGMWPQYSVSQVVLIAWGRWRAGWPRRLQRPRNVRGLLT